ncbi:type III effector, partial [Pseudomonas syringae pv. tagetis]
SNNIKHLLERVVSDPALQHKIDGVVDLNNLKDCEGDLYVMSWWAARASESREKIGKARY